MRAQTPERKRADRLRRYANPEQAAKRRERYQREVVRMRDEVIAGYGGQCECCGTTFRPHLTLDHVNGGGGAERRAEPGQRLWRRLRREGFPPGYRVLCWNCNWAAHRLGRCSCSD